MKGRNLFIIALLVLAAGIALVCLKTSLRSSGIVVACGVLFIMAGVFNMAVFLGQRRGGRSGGAISATFNWVSSVAAVTLGLCMLLFVSTFVSLVSFMFGVLIAFGALYQFFLLGYGSRPATLPGWLFIVPTLLAGMAVYLFIKRADEVPDTLLMLLTGISLIVFGATTLLESVLIGRYNRQTLRAGKAEAKAKEVEARREEESANPDKSTAPASISNTDTDDVAATSQKS